MMPFRELTRNILRLTSRAELAASIKKPTAFLQRVSYFRTINWLAPASD
jgi:hypothetical protein